MSVSRYTVKLDIGDGRFKSLASQLNRLNKEIDRVYQRGQDNNNTVSDKDLTNLQSHLSGLVQAIDDKKQRTNEQLDQARIVNDTDQIAKFLDELKELTDAGKESNQLFSSYKFNQVNNYRVTSSRAFRTNDFDKINSDFQHDLTDLKDNIGKLSNRSKILERRWDRGVFNGAITYERWQKYQDQNQTQANEYDNYNSQYQELKKQYDDQLQQLTKERNVLNNRIESGKGSQDDITKRSALDEQIIKMRKVDQTLSDLANTLNNTGSRINLSNAKLHDKQTVDTVVLPAKDSLKGFLSTHKRILTRSAIVGAVGNTIRAYNTGNSLILNNFDNIKSTVYASGLGENKVENTLADAGFSMGYGLDEMSNYLNNYTSATGNANLSQNQIKDVTRSWAGLSRYSGANDSTTQNLEYVSAMTSLAGTKEFSSLANAIQNEITNSGMNAKANEQQQALANMYQTAFNVSGSTLSTRDQKEIAGFQGVMAQTGKSELQGQQGAQAYAGLVSAFQPSNIASLRLFTGNNPAYQTREGHAQAIFDMQDASKHPYKYKTAIDNLLRNAKTQARTKNGDVTIASGNLYQLSKENGGNLSPQQAKDLVELYKHKKFTKKNVDKIVKGSGKGNKDKYDKTGAKTIQQQQKAIQESEVKASHALNHFTHKLNWINKTFWISNIMSGVGTSMGVSMLGDLGVGLIYGGYAKSGYQKIAGSLKNRGFKGTLSAIKGKGSSLKDTVISTVSNAKSNKSSSSVSGTKTIKRAKSGVKINPTTLVKSGSKVPARKIGKAGALIGVGMGAYALYDSYKNDNKAHASTVNPKEDNSRPKNNKQSNKKASNMTVSKLAKQVQNKYKRLHKSEWRLIDYLNTYWDIFLRKAKESGSSSSSSDDVGSDSGGDSAKSPEEWKDDIKKAAKAMGQNVSDEQVNMIVSMIKAESGGDPTVTQQISDINSANGHPAQGLLQYVPSTFEHYAVKGHTNIKSGYDQLLALFNDSNWARDIHYGGGWGPTGNPIKTNATGGIRYHATGNTYSTRVAQAPTSQFSMNLQHPLELQTLFKQNIRKSQNYIKVQRNRGKVNVNVNVNHNNILKFQQVVDQTINEEFNLWLQSKKTEQYASFYSNEVG